MNFSTMNIDHDRNSSFNCAFEYKGGWWFDNCLMSNLNGEFGNMLGKGIIWETWRGQESLSWIEMKIRPYDVPDELVSGVERSVQRQFFLLLVAVYLLFYFTVSDRLIV